jgi:hypothetical protein
MPSHPDHLHRNVKSWLTQVEMSAFAKAIESAACTKVVRSFLAPTVWAHSPTAHPRSRNPLCPIPSSAFSLVSRESVKVSIIRQWQNKLVDTLVKQALFSSDCIDIHLDISESTLFAKTFRETYLTYVLHP